MITKLEEIKQAAIRRKDIEDAVLKAVDHLDEKSEARFPLSPSAALKPLRDLYYGLVNYYKPGTIPQDPLPPTTKLTFKLGHMVEAMVVDYFREAYQLKDEQRKVKFGQLPDGPELTGSIDWAVVINGETILMDSKSSGSYPFKLAPKEDNIAQMQLYMHSDWARKNNVNRAILAYFNKDNSEIKCMEIKYDPILAEMLLQRLYKVWDYYKRGEVPPREYVLGLDWQANYSGYRTYDFSEFRMPVEKRATVTSTISAPTETKENLRAFVLQYGNSIVQYRDKAVYVASSATALSFQTVGQKVWAAV